jgi:hypothetical protein
MPDLLNEGEKMERQIIKPEPMFRFRALIERDEERGIFVGQCLETGSVCTADDADTAQDIMAELLEDEIAFNLDHDNLANLLNCPAPSRIWLNYIDASHKQNLALDPKVTRWPFRDLRIPLAVVSIRMGHGLVKIGD